jgi:cytoskeletal protein CcmA (bactofilin family)
MPVDVTAELAKILDGSQITILADDIKSDIDGAGKVLVCKGDLSQGWSIRGARAIVIDGDVSGHPNALSEIFANETVIVLGDVLRANIQAAQLFVRGAVTNALLFIKGAIEVGQHVSDVQVRLGPSTDYLKVIQERHLELQALKPHREELAQQVEAARRGLSRLLQVTGVKFNLNIGKIVQQSKDGLQINLKTFYEAVDGRSEEEIDRALRQFFAKAVLGLLTRLNRDYIASGRGHQERFKKVVLKLQDLVLKSREYDKFVNRHRSDTVQVEALGDQYTVNFPNLVIQGRIHPSFEVAIHGVVENAGSLSLQEHRLEIEAGRREGADEARFFVGQTLKDMVFVSSQTLEDVIIHVVNNKISWESRT